MNWPRSIMDEPPFPGMERVKPDGWRDVCCAPSPHGNMCMLRDGHEGDHSDITKLANNPRLKRFKGVLSGC
jgi:hypothetical protein